MNNILSENNIPKLTNYTNTGKYSNDEFKYLMENLEWFNCTKALYFASGEYNEGLMDSIKKLNIEKLILIDYRFEKTVLLDNIAFISLEAREAIKLFKILNLKFDVFICLNTEFLYLPYKYSMHSNYFLAYAMSILKDTYIHIYSSYLLDSPYLSHISDLGYKVTKLEMFKFYDSFLNHDAGHIDICKMEKEKVYIEIYKLDNLIINIINKSIWCDQDYLDFIYVKCQYKYYKHTISRKTRFMIFDKKSNFNIIVNNVIKNLNLEHNIGFIPFGNKLLKKLLNKIKHLNAEINLYHLNKNDYKFIKDSFELIKIVEENKYDLPFYKASRYKNQKRFKEHEKRIREIYRSKLLPLF